MATLTPRATTGTLDAGCGSGWFATELLGYPRLRTSTMVDRPAVVE